jgi:prepilin-type N-terminal cleavage/methylation domain-containing protein
MMRGGVWVRAGRGFSLIEILGVLAIMGILASMTVPPILRQIRQAQSGNEDANLEEVARAIVEGIRAEGRIPDPSVTALSSNGWIGVASNYSSLGTNALLLVYPNNTNTQRRFYLSGNFEAWLIGNGFQTPSAGWPANDLPAETQFMLVSSSREDLALPTPLNAADFDRLKAWNKSYVGGFIQVPDLSTPFGPLWQPSADPTKALGQYLHVKTVDLKPLLCLVQLEDSQSPPTVSTNSAGAGYNGFGPVIINSNGVAISVNFAGTNSTNTQISSVALASLPGRILWDVSGRTNGSGLSISNNVTVPGGVGGSINLFFPGTPSYSVMTNAPAFMSSQDQSFYVIKGTSLFLGDTNQSVQQNVVILKNSNFRFINGTWSRVD